MKRCCYCRSDLPETKPGVSAEVQCDKCKKNEAKYKTKPTVCMYCQLPAAFVDNKCVFCCYSERKSGPPVACAQCKLKAAFPKDPSQKGKPLFCRMCLITHKASAAKGGSKEVASSGKPSADVKPTVHHKRKAEEPSEHKSKISKNSLSPEASTEHAQSEHILLIQQFKNEIHDLQKKCAEKDRMILERDKKVAALNAEMMRAEREYKEKAAMLHKQHHDRSLLLQEQIRELNKRIRQNQKH